MWIWHTDNNDDVNLVIGLNFVIRWLVNYDFTKWSLHKIKWFLSEAINLYPYISKLGQNNFLNFISLRNVIKGLCIKTLLPIDAKQRVLLQKLLLNKKKTSDLKFMNCMYKTFNVIWVSTCLASFIFSSFPPFYDAIPLPTGSYREWAPHFKETLTQKTHKHIHAHTHIHTLV